MISNDVRAFHGPLRRLVSLVPSITESLFDLGFGDRVVGITDYCLHPADQLNGLPRVGGPKNPNLHAILALQPDLILANREENTPAALEKLAASGLHIWLTFPRSVAETLSMLRDMALLFRSARAMQQIAQLERSLEWARAAARNRPAVRYFCPIWQGEREDEPWWMTFNSQTYMSDLLSLLGGENVFATRQRRYPLAADLGLAPPQPAPGRDRRYPRVTRAEILAAAPEVILLPDEPYPYNETHLTGLRQQLAATPAVQDGRLLLIDGSLLTWQGTRLAKALQLLDPFTPR